MLLQNNKEIAVQTRHILLKAAFLHLDPYGLETKIQSREKKCSLSIEYDKIEILKGEKAKTKINKTKTKSKKNNKTLIFPHGDK